ncbi:type A chloramphenicol O-acetyltransferase [Bacillus altitudinis]|uniref:type A chloramphenicol O-acetyltransferase n=1 Tax=Bacillus altitudinis TaxID=293387 RepID=UPI0022830115|nr:type A chloramphenicol O-acetyltransferase [Bacillus altitudinis]MCY7690695.1 type A chloramphenicol O-acetyltransferase [Bacillus altitudinis]
MFKQIDENYPRKEHFHHYMTVTRCTYSLVIDLDITKLYAILKEKRLKVYPVQIYLLARAVQKIPEFRMDQVNDALGYWEILHPSYTILNKETKTFSSIWTPYDENFARFYKSCVADMDTYSKSNNLFPKPHMPENMFNISSLPWIDFTSFNLNVSTDITYLLPIFTLGQFKMKEGKIILPVAIQVHHAVCDGYHVGQYVEYLRWLIEHCEEWLDDSLDMS